MGDKNTRFFHQATLCRHRHNRISALLDHNQNWVYDDHDLMNLVVNFYQDLYTLNPHANSSFVCSFSFPDLKEEDANMLCRPVSTEETHFALFSMGNLKSPGPDGFHLLFFKSQWDVLGPSILKFVQQVFAMPSRIQEANQTLISLIPKKDDPSMIAQFRPIALCNVIYKIVTKLIANRLRATLPYMVRHQQSSFISGA